MNNLFTLFSNQQILELYSPRHCLKSSPIHIASVRWFWIGSAAKIRDSLRDASTEILPKIKGHEYWPKLSCPFYFIMRVAMNIHHRVTVVSIFYFMLYLSWSFQEYYLLCLLLRDHVLVISAWYMLWNKFPALEFSANDAKFSCTNWVQLVFVIFDYWNSCFTISQPLHFGREKTNRLGALNIDISELRRGADQEMKNYGN